MRKLKRGGRCFEAFVLRTRMTQIGKEQSKIDIQIKEVEDIVRKIKAIRKINEEVLQDGN